MADRMVPGTRYVDLVGTQSTGRSGALYLLIDAIVAVQGGEEAHCKVLLSGTTDWFQVDMSALELINLMKVTGS